MNGSVDHSRIRQLLEVGRALVADLDPSAIFDRVLEAGREITGARYAALGVLNEERTELERFITAGLDADAHRAIGELPRGRGVLGVLIEDPHPLRLSDVGRHPSSYGFPSAHPVMRSFLGVPIRIRGETWGNLYLTEKSEGEFTEADEEAAVILAEWAGTAIENARLYQTSERRRRELERAVRGLEATRDIAIAIGAETRLERVLELIVKRGRALIDARSVLIMLRDGVELAVAARAGRAIDVHGRRVPIQGSTYGQVLERGRAERIGDVASRLQIAAGELAVPDARTALLVPMLHRGRTLGVLAAFDRGDRGEAFTDEDEQLLRAFAASAATAVATAQSVATDRLRSSVEAAEAERRRWARELHDETLQGLGALRLLLSAALRRGDPAGNIGAMGEALGQIDLDLASLRAMIAELRPVALDALGLRAALEALLERRRDRDGLEVLDELDVPDSHAGPAERLGVELETAVYRLVQEALTNVARHADARTVRVRASDDEVLVEVQDDGVGFDVEAVTSGFGLAGMRERAYLTGGTLEIESGRDGTLVRARLGAQRGDAIWSAAEQAAS